MTQPPAGSIRDTAALAACYSETSHWQHERGLLLIETAAPSGAGTILDLGCGTGELTAALARRVGPRGRVIGVDPDPARLEFARRNAPPGLDNLGFVQASGEELGPIADGTIDLVYSNYALHWVLDPPAVFDELRRVLRPGGRVVTEFLGMFVALFTELLLLMPGGRAMLRENIILDEPAWRAVVTPRFDVVELSWPRFGLAYKDLPSLFAWLEATSHGAFDRTRIAPKDHAALARRFPGDIACECTGLRMILRKPG